MIVSDFDFTLSKLWYPSQLEAMRAARLKIEESRTDPHRGDAAMSAMKNTHKMTERIWMRTVDNFNKFRPIEKDINLTP